ncbi:hypothetical protein D9Q98_004107 [Chlorella vulgaris]|uniref:Uncharacterized protein n=1 Tax=Chlorella vulgaris TaxID=3077 RepID=A0A9D4TRF7_CHLVU|nr:hypothetical protein D9Q98_004107 [Chlorella vulgaris]
MTRGQVDWQERARTVLRAVNARELSVSPSHRQRVKDVERLGDRASDANRAYVGKVFSGMGRAPTGSRSRARKTQGPRQLTNAQRQATNALARRVVQNAFAQVAFRSAAKEARRAPRRALAPKGMGGQSLFTVEDNAVTLDPIPTKRAVKVGKQWWDSKTLLTLVARNGARARNPLTREPLPPAIHRRAVQHDVRQAVAAAKAMVRRGLTTKSDQDSFITPVADRGLVIILCTLVDTNGEVVLDVYVVQRGALPAGWENRLVDVDEMSELALHTLWFEFDSRGKLTDSSPAQWPVRGDVALQLARGIDSGIRRSFARTTA